VSTNLKSTQIPEPVSPTGPRVVVFWVAYALGTLTLIFSFLLAQVPRSRHGADFTLDYICWSVAGVLLLASLCVARYTWSFWNPLRWHGMPSAIQLFVGVAWVEFALSIYGILSFATSR
jgi:hypothetical protein